MLGTRDDLLAEAAEQIENQPDITAEESRARMCKAVEERYNAKLAAVTEGPKQAL